MNSAEIHNLAHSISKLCPGLLFGIGTSGEPGDFDLVVLDSEKGRTCVIRNGVKFEETPMYQLYVLKHGTEEKIICPMCNKEFEPYFMFNTPQPVGNTVCADCQHLVVT